MSASTKGPPVAVLRWCCTGLGGLVIAGALAINLAGHPGPVPTVLAVFGGLFLLAGALAGLTGARFTLSCCATLVGLVAVFLVGRDTFIFFGWSYLHGDRPLGIHLRDPRYCYRHQPGAAVVHTQPEFKARYTIDALGDRVTPTPASSAGHVTILGCSFTFGHGVGDRQHYPYLLGQDHWPRIKVRNRAVMGWGTSQALLTLEQELQQKDLPRLVLYAWMRDHLYRPYRMDYCLKIAPERIDQFLEGQPEDEHVVNQIKGAVLIKEMARLCRKKGVPFRVLILSSPSVFPGQNERDEYGAMKRLLDRHEVPYVDLSAVAPQSFYRFDKHPTAAWHRKVAAAIARRQLLPGP